MTAFRCRTLLRVVAILLFASSAQLWAEDRLVLKDGSVLRGEIVDLIDSRLRFKLTQAESGVLVFRTGASADGVETQSTVH